MSLFGNNAFITGSCRNNNYIPWSFCQRTYMKYEATETTTLVYPLQYTHKCTKCGKTETFTISYPRTVYEYNMPEITPVVTTTNRDHLRDVVNNLLKHNFSSPLKDDCKDETIAAVFGYIGNCDVCPLDDNHHFKCSTFSCDEDILKYLQKYGDEPYVQ